MINLLVTGATGYIGHAFAAYATAQGAYVLTLARRKPEAGYPFKYMVPNDWENVALLAKVMEGRQTIVHCAGLAHNKLGDMWAVNLDLTIALAEAAKMAGVPRFVFISTASVFGESGTFGVDDEPFPTTEYGHSKREAEDSILAIFKGSQTAVSIIRPPMVIGHNAPGKAAVLRRFAKSWPLPFGTLTSPRSYIELTKLTDILWPEARQTSGSALIHASEPPLPACDLVRLILAQDGIKPFLFPVPPFVFSLLPPLRQKLAPLLERHILTSGRKELDRIV